MYLLVSQTLREAGYVHYEISNFALPGFESRHNSSYWSGTAYLGLGPSAHSFNGATRSANVAHLKRYAEALNSGKPLREVEVLTAKNQHNEAVLLGLRTRKGILLKNFSDQFGPNALKRLLDLTADMPPDWFDQKENQLVLSYTGFSVADAISSALFI
jgi:oxygen-independent coproporphyrinogen-3 oxidase